jgi:hypothetical protein
MHGRKEGKIIDGRKAGREEASRQEGGNLVETRKGGRKEGK